MKNVHNKNLETALNDLKTAIEDVALGSVSNVVIMEAGLALIDNWNDNNESDDLIDELYERQEWLNSL